MESKDQAQDEAAELALHLAISWHVRRALEQLVAGANEPVN
jgi:hypothetical protein